ncbi:MAG: cellulase N-terminal Ig-like domain-containing protein, partial [Bacteroidales bacterium]
MKRLFVFIFALFMGCHVSAQGYIRINYAGYLPQSKKVAVYMLADTSVKAVQNAAQHSAPVRLAEAQFDAVKFADINSAGNSRSKSGFSIQKTDASDTTDNRFFVFNATTDSLVFIGNAKKCDPSKWALKEAYRLDFSKLELSGGYY